VRHTMGLRVLNIDVSCSEPLNSNEKTPSGVFFGGAENRTIAREGPETSVCFGYTGKSQDGVTIADLFTGRSEVT